MTRTELFGEEICVIPCGAQPHAVARHAASENGDPAIDPRDLGAYENSRRDERQNSAHDDSRDQAHNDFSEHTIVRPYAAFASKVWLVLMFPLSKP